MKNAEGEAADVLTDIFDSDYERLLKMRLHYLGKEIFDGYEAGEKDFSSVYEKLDEIEKGYKDFEDYQIESYIGMTYLDDGDETLE